MSIRSCCSAYTLDSVKQYYTWAKSFATTSLCRKSSLVWSRYVYINSSWYVRFEMWNRQRQWPWFYHTCIFVHQFLVSRACICDFCVLCCELASSMREPNSYVLSRVFMGQWRLWSNDLLPPKFVRFVTLLGLKWGQKLASWAVSMRKSWSLAQLHALGDVRTTFHPVFWSIGEGWAPKRSCVGACVGV